jgi:hypothetical protein
MTNEIRELCIDELDAVSGGTWMDAVIAVTTAINVINDVGGAPKS